MAEGSKRGVGTKGRGGATSSSVTSRAAQRRVHLPASSRTAPVMAPPAPRRPLYRRGGFWFAVIALEAVAALGVSMVAATDPADVSRTGGDGAQFCYDVNQSIQANAASVAIDVDNAPTEYQKRVDFFLRLGPIAPTDIQPDVEQLARLNTDLVVTAKAVQEQKRANPAETTGPRALADKQAEVDRSGATAQSRLGAAVSKTCGVDLNRAAPTSVAPTTALKAPGAPVPAS
jgi:hypothetical protein